MYRRRFKSSRPPSLILSKYTFFEDFFCLQRTVVKWTQFLNIKCRARMWSCKLHLKEVLVVPLALTCGPASSSQLLAQQLVYSLYNLIKVSCLSIHSTELLRATMKNECERSRHCRKDYHM